MTMLFALIVQLLHRVRKFLFAAGVLLAVWVGNAAATFRLPGDLPVRLDFHLDARVVAYAASLVIVTGVIAGVLLAYVPPSTPLLAVFAFAVMGVGVGGVNTLMWALEADTVEYGEWKSGVRTEGTTYALFSFTRKMGQALGGAAGAYALGWVAFNSQAATEGTPQSASTVDGIQFWTGALTAGFILVALLIMWFYPLTDKVFRQIVGEIAARRAEREGAGAAPEAGRV